MNELGGELANVWLSMTGHGLPLRDELHEYNTYRKAERGFCFLFFKDSVGLAHVETENKIWGGGFFSCLY